MPDKLREAKLSANQQLKVCALIAVGYNAQRISDILEEEDGVNVTLQNIYYNYIKNPRWKKIIERISRHAERKILKHPLAQKVNRLNILKDAINEAFTWRLDKINYDKQGNELSRVEKRNIGMVANLIHEARAEVEGEKPLFQINQYTQIWTQKTEKAQEVDDTGRINNSRINP